MEEDMHRHIILVLSQLNCPEINHLRMRFQSHTQVEQEREKRAQGDEECKYTHLRQKQRVWLKM